MSRSSKIAEKKKSFLLKGHSLNESSIWNMLSISAKFFAFYFVLISIFSCCEELFPSNSGHLLQHLLSYKIQNCKSGLE